MGKYRAPTRRGTRGSKRRYSGRTRASSRGTRTTLGWKGRAGKGAYRGSLMRGMGDFASGGVLSGSGAYGASSKISHNSLVVGQIPKIRNPGREGATQVRHREYICDISVDSTYNGEFKIFDLGLKTGTASAGDAPSLRLNAGLAGTFPWLSQIAQQYTQFQINGCMVEFVSESSASSSANNGASGLGTIMLSTQYNSAAPAFTNKQQMLNEEFAVSGKPAQTLVHPIECARDQTTIPLLYTRLENPAPGTSIDPQLFDLGLVTLAMQGVPPPAPGSGGTTTSTTIGELWITYDMLLYKPQLTSAFGGS